MVVPDRYGNDPPEPGSKPPLDPLRAPVLTAGERIRLYKTQNTEFEDNSQPL